MTRPALWSLAFAFAAFVGCTSSEAPSDGAAEVQGDASSDVPTDPVCPTGRLPTEGTACDPVRMPAYAYCRLDSCGWGTERECACRRDGTWSCSSSSRDDWGCGTPPFCTEKTSSITCQHDDASVDATKPDANDGGVCDSGFPLYATGPWNTSKSCWPSTVKYFECVSGIDGGTMFTCFVHGGEFFLAPTTQIPSDARPCTDAERATHGTYQRCE